MENYRDDKKRGNPFRRHLLYLALGYIAAVLVTAAFYGVVPKSYRASATIFQPLEAPRSTGTGTTRFPEETLSRVRTNTELFFSVLGSRRMKDEVINRFNLMKAYRARNADEAREILSARTAYTLTKDKVIEVVVVDQDPVRAAEMANFFVSTLDTLLQEMTITAAKQNRVFIEKRVDETVQLIEGLEARLKKIQNEQKLVADRNEAKITEVAGQIMQQRIEKQLELERKRAVLADTDPEIRMLQREIGDLQTTMKNLLASKDDLTRIQRELAVQESVYSFLMSRLEEAKIGEAKDTPTVQVLDRASVPDRVYRPDLVLLMVIVSAAFGSIGLIVLFFDALKFLGSL